MSRWLRSGTAVAALVPLAACSGGSTARSLPPDGAPAGTTAPAAAATTSPADQVETAYLRYWAAVIGAHRAADPKSAALAAVAADPQLSKVRLTVERNRLQQVSLRGQVTHQVSAPTIAGATATLEDCYDISDWDPVNLRTGAAIDAAEEGGTGRYRARYTLRRAGAGWRVTTESALGGC